MQYLELTVEDIIHETPDAITIVFQKPKQVFHYKSGQFITLIAHIENEEVRRAYSLCSAPDIDGLPAVTVKRVIHGKMSNHLMDHLKIGDVMKIMEPIGNFTTTFHENNERHLILFGGGSGITPLISIAKSALKIEPKSTVSLIYANRNQESIIFKNKLEALVEQYPKNLKIVHILDHPPQDWKGLSGIPSIEILEKAYQTLPQEHSHTEYFICGPEGMMNNAETLLEKLQVEKEKIHKESFTSSASAEKQNEIATSQDKAREVTVIYEGEEYKFSVEPGNSILETALDLDIDLPYSCQSGLCTACRGKCLSGTVVMEEEEGLSQQEIDEGYVLTCVGHPTSDDVVIEIG